MFYIGWFGAYFISLRNLPEGKWWILVVLPAVWFADTGAYFIGKRFGRHKLSPRLSPKKTWEGYLGGIVVGVILTALFAALWRVGAGPNSGITVLRGALMGLVMGIFPTLGDLGESMIKRQMGVKDSGNILPGHGGAFDRIDSWLWAVVMGYYLIVWLWS
jgi:phosphatidate cytidylyltransferase